MRLKLGAYKYLGYNMGDIAPFSDLFDDVNLYQETSLENVNAVIVWGGADISPSLYQEIPYVNSGPRVPSERDIIEWGLMQEAYKNNIPIIGVCRGAQMLCAFAGGKLIQHVNGHGMNHWVKTVDGSSYFVTSSHHQMMYPYDVSHSLLAWSAPSKATVYEPRDRPYIASMAEKKEPEVVFFPDVRGLAIQPHPEWEDDTGTPFLLWLNKTIKHLLLT